MTGITTSAANDVGSKILLLRTVVLAVTDLATILASLVLIVTQRTVQRGELSKLVTLELVLALGD